jgi:RsiW-degrading membrane proteinase PrsW (M82 family)
MTMSFYHLIFLIVLSFLPSLFWLFCYYFYFPRFTTPKSFLGILFFLGMIAAGAGVLIHQNILRLMPDFVFSTFQKYLLGLPSFKISEVLIMFLIMFFLVAPVEELLKFLVIKLAISRKPGYLDQIIDGIKFGVVVGLGFAVVENAIYFYQPFSVGGGAFFFKLFLTRFLISTLAHSLYTGIMGYYIGLSRLYRLHSRYLLRKGIFMAIIMHGVFNFFLLINLGFFSIGVLIVLLWLMIKWGRDRESLESFINAEQYQNIFIPVFSGKKELESFLFRHRIRYDVIKKLNLCPFCFRKKEFNQDICPHCKMKQPA